jgi:hypothetical protein
MKQSISIILFLLWAIMGFTATGVVETYRDTFPLAKVTTKGGRIVLGQLQYVTDSTLQILPGTRKEAKRGYFYEPVTLHYSEIISFRVRTNYWIGLAIGLLGATGIALMITGDIPIFNNGLGEANIYIWLSPLMIGASVWKMLQRKRFAINGNKSRFDKFKSWIQKKRSSF